jgi:hypothetical protein
MSAVDQQIGYPNAALLARCKGDHCAGVGQSAQHTGATGAALVADATAGPRSDPADIVAFLEPFLAPPVQQGLAGPADDQTHDVLAEMSPLLLQFDENRSVRQGPVAIDHTQVGAARFAG